MKEEQSGNGDGRAYKTIHSVLMAVLIGVTSYLSKTTVENTNAITRLQTTMDERNIAAKDAAEDNKATQAKLLSSVATLHDEVQMLDFRMKAVEKSVK